MRPEMWPQDYGRALVCVDSYEDGVLKGRLLGSPWEAEAFGSLSEFLVRMDALLDDTRRPQASTAQRTFSPTLPYTARQTTEHLCCRGDRATFSLQIRFRRNSSWQGMLRWKEGNQEKAFRSVLEMVFLMDSALRCPDPVGADSPVSK